MAKVMSNVPMLMAIPPLQTDSEGEGKDINVDGEGEVEDTDVNGEPPPIPNWR